MAMALKIAKIISVQPINKHTATLFLFHGSGDTGSGIKEWIDILNREELKFPHIKVVYPTAPLQPYTPLEGMMSNVWFDRHAINKDAPENAQSIDNICKVISELIDNEVKNGIPIGRMAVGGFSMGGSLSMHLAYRYKPSMAGCVVMSSFLNDNSSVYDVLNANIENNRPPLLQFHGLEDALVPPAWGELTHNLLSNLKVETEYVPLPGVQHELVKSEVEKFKQWIALRLPE